MRVLSFPDELQFSGDGAYNMALDEAMFEANDYRDPHRVCSKVLLSSMRPTITIPIRYDGEDLCPREDRVRRSVKLSRTH